MPWAGTWTAVGDRTSPAETTGPFPILIPPEQPPPRQSRLVLVLVAAVVVVGLVLAIFSLRDLVPSHGGNRNDATGPLISPHPAQAATQPAQTSPETTQPAQTTQSPVTTSPAVTAAAPVISGVQAIDPKGDGNENNADAGKAVDGQRSTYWQTDTYNTAAFGGLKKGVGLAIKLQRAAVIRQVEVDVNGSGGRLELRGSSSAALDGSVVLDASDPGGGTVILTSTSKSTFSYVILWFTRLPTSGGKHRAEVADVRVS